MTDLNLDVDEIVVKELMYMYNLYNRYNKIDNAQEWIDPEYEVLNAIKILLQQYLPTKEYDYWESTLTEPKGGPPNDR